MTERLKDCTEESARTICGGAGSTAAVFLINPGAILS